MKYANIKKLLEVLRGYQTVEDIQKELNVSRNQAIYIIYRLRKRGFVKTYYMSNRKRRYYISLNNAIGGSSYLEVMNRYNPIGMRLVEFDKHRIYGRDISIEETIIYCIKQRQVRYALACLSLFRKVKNWSLLYSLAKKGDVVREIATLHEIARLVIPKVRKMPKRFYNLALPDKKSKYKYIIENFDSQDFHETEKKWKVYLCFNKADLKSVIYEYALAGEGKYSMQRQKVNYQMLEVAS